MPERKFELTGLTGREYKMMLKPKRFFGDPRQAARRFWKKQAGVVADHLDHREDFGDFDKLFGDPKPPRPVRFRDTGELLLDSAGYSLRVRDEGDDQEVTLKLRTPDIYVSGLARLRGNHPKAQTKFEEDIAPLEVQRKGRVVSSEEISTRSRFSGSTTMPLADGREPETLEGVFALFPDLERSLPAAGKKLDPRARLKRGPSITEYVFKSSGIELLPGVEIGFAFTLWYFDLEGWPNKNTTPDVAEVSFKLEIEKRNGGGLKPIVATSEEDRRKKLRRGAASALGLFIAMQRKFAKWVDKENSSKTKLGLPKPSKNA